MGMIYSSNNALVDGPCGRWFADFLLDKRAEKFVIGIRMAEVDENDSFSKAIQSVSKFELWKLCFS
jgi:hypothetical protein